MPTVADGGLAAEALELAGDDDFFEPLSRGGNSAGERERRQQRYETGNGQISGRQTHDAIFPGGCDSFVTAQYVSGAATDADIRLVTEPARRFRVVTGSCHEPAAAMCTSPATSLCVPM